MSTVDFDFEEFKEFFNALDRINSDFKKEMALFIEALGIEFLDIVTDEIERKISAKDGRTGNLAASFMRGNSNNIWEQKNPLVLTVGSNLNYAAPVNNGHWTCKNGKKGRWVPGYFSGDEFIYVPNSNTGMYVRQQWIKPQPFFDFAFEVFKREAAQIFENKIEKLLSLI